MGAFIGKHKRLCATYLAIVVTSATIETGLAFILASLADAVTHADATRPGGVGLRVVVALAYLVPLGVFEWLRLRITFRLETAYVAATRHDLVSQNQALALPAQYDRLVKTDRLQSAIISDAQTLGADYAGSITGMISNVCVLVAVLSLIHI